MADEIEQAKDASRDFVDADTQLMVSVLLDRFAKLAQELSVNVLEPILEEIEAQL